MRVLNYISNSIIPIVITIIVLFAMREKIKIFDTFIEGAKEGMEIVINLFPTLLGLFVAIGALRSAGIIDFIIKMLTPLINFIGIPKEIMPLALIRPISRKCVTSSRYRYNESIWSGQ